MFKEGFKDASRKMEGCFKEALRLLKGVSIQYYFQEVKRKLHECFKGAEKVT